MPINDHTIRIYLEQMQAFNPYIYTRMRVLTVTSVFASIFIHIVILFFGIIIFSSVNISQDSLSQGEQIKVEFITLHTVASMTSSDTSSSSSYNTEPPSLSSGSEKAVVEEKKAITFTTTKKRKPAEIADAESRQRTEHAMHVGTANNEETISQNGEGVYTTSGYGYGATPLGSHINPRPEYPEMARQRGQEGKTVLLVDVNIQGNPEKIQILESSGHQLLDKVAVKTVWRWKFTPARSGNVSVPGQVVLPVEFCLR